MEKTPLSTASKSKTSPHVPDFTDVIWLQTSFIGDIVLTTAAMSALNKLRPGINQHLITTAAGASALEKHPLLKSIHVFTKRKSSIKALFKIRSDIRNLGLKHPLILQPHKSFRSTILSKILGYKLITYVETNFSFLAHTRIPRVAVMHETDRIALLLEGLGLERRDFLGFKPVLPTASPEERHPALAQIVSPKKATKWIAIAPGSVWATKRWPTAKFAALSHQLLERHDIGIILLGSREDQSSCNFIEAACLQKKPTARDRVVNLAGKTSLGDLTGIYPHLKLLISNDSSPIHYASAFNIPTIAVFGATVPAMGFGPLADKSQVAEIALSCRPCGDHGHKSCPLRHFKCMNDLTVEYVLNLVPEL